MVLSRTRLFLHSTKTNSTVSAEFAADIATVGQQEDIQLFSSEQAEYLCIVLNLRSENVPFFADKSVRQALLMGINRPQLIETVAAGQGIVADSPFLPENWAYNAQIRKYPYDPVQAAQLLDQAGWRDSNGDGVRDKDGKPMQFQLFTNDSSTLRIELINSVVEDWKKLGIQAIATPVEFSGLVNDFLVPRRFDAVLLEWEITGDPDPLDLWHSSQAEGSGSNYGGWANDEADKLMEQARTTADEATRQQLYYKFQDIFAEETPALMLYYPVYTYGVSNRIKNVQIDSLNRPSERFESIADGINTACPQTRCLPIPHPPPATIDGKRAKTELHQNFSQRIKTNLTAIGQMLYLLPIHARRSGGIASAYVQVMVSTLVGVQVPPAASGRLS